MPWRSDVGLPTPQHCTADFCLIPLGTPTASVSKEVAEVQKLLKKSGLNYHMHSAGSTVEGSWDEVMRLIGQCHAMLHNNGVVRIQSDIRIGTRTDKHQTFKDKVSAVEKLLANDKTQGGTEVLSDQAEQEQLAESGLGAS